jgi:hypothetical protein
MSEVAAGRSIGPGLHAYGIVPGPAGGTQNPAAGALSGRARGTASIETLCSMTAFTTCRSKLFRVPKPLIEHGTCKDSYGISKVQQKEIA